MYGRFNWPEYRIHLFSLGDSQEVQHVKNFHISSHWASLYKFLVRLILLRLVCICPKPLILLTISKRVLINLFSLPMRVRVFLIFLEVEAMLTSSSLRKIGII